MNKATTLEHYQRVLEEAQAAEFDRAARAHRLEAGLIVAQFEARYTGPFNWSGKELDEQETLSADTAYSDWLDKLNQQET